MNAREALIALAEGKKLRRRKATIFLDGDRLLSSDRMFCVEEIWLDGCEVVEEYPLTFEEALRAMLDGKVVQSEFTGDKYRFNNEDSHFECYGMRSWYWYSPESPEQIRKWKVVKE